MAPPLAGPAGAERGFSLIEILVAMVVLGVALLLGLALVLEQPRVVRRLDAQRQALRAIDSSLEALRAGVVPLQTADLEGFSTGVGMAAPADLTVHLDVVPGTPSGLYQVTLTARYSVLGTRLARRVETLVWRP